MPTDPGENITQLLAAARDGDVRADAQLLTVFYRELHRQGHYKLQQCAGGHTWQTSDLVHEVFVRLGWGTLVRRASNRKYLFGAAARCMLRVLCDHYRARRALKRGGGVRAIPLDDVSTCLEERNINVLGLQEILADLAEIKKRPHECIMLHYFAGCTVAEIAQMYGLSSKTVEADLRYARAWLRRRLHRFDE